MKSFPYLSYNFFFAASKSNDSISAPGLASQHSFPFGNFLPLITFFLNSSGNPNGGNPK